MNLSTIAPPAGISRAATAAMQHINLRKFAVATAGGTAPTALHPSTPHRVYTLALDALAAGRELNAVQESGFRMLLTDGNEVLATVNMRQTTVGGGVEFQSVSQNGPYVEGVDQAIRFAESAAATVSPSYEIRLLQIPGLYIIAIWLHGSADELFIPVNPAPAPLQSNRIYTERQFFQPLPSMAQSRLSMDNSPPDLSPHAGTP